MSSRLLGGQPALGWVGTGSGGWQALTRAPLSRLSRYNLSLGIGLDRVKGKVFRIGHLGNLDELMLSSALCGAEMAMIDAGVPIKPGSGVSKALEYWQKTSKVIPTRESLLK